MVWQSAGINGTNGTVTGNIVVPATVTLNTVTRMRVIAEETASAASVTPCGAYTAGETQDYNGAVHRHGQRCGRFSAGISDP